MEYLQSKVCTPSLAVSRSSRTHKHNRHYNIILELYLFFRGISWKCHCPLRQKLSLSVNPFLFEPFQGVPEMMLRSRVCLSLLLASCYDMVSNEKNIKSNKIVTTENIYNIRKPINRKLLTQSLNAIKYFDNAL